MTNQFRFIERKKRIFCEITIQTWQYTQNCRNKMIEASPVQLFHKVFPHSARGA